MYCMLLPVFLHNVILMSTNKSCRHELTFEGKTANILIYDWCTSIFPSTGAACTDCQLHFGQRSIIGTKDLVCCICWQPAGALQLPLRWDLNLYEQKPLRRNWHKLQFRCQSVLSVVNVQLAPPCSRQTSYSFTLILLSADPTIEPFHWPKPYSVDFHSEMTSKKMLFKHSLWHRTH